MRDVKRITVRLPCRFTARELNDPRSAFGNASEFVDGDAFAERASEVTTKRDLIRVGLALTKEDEERSSVRCFYFHKSKRVRVKLELAGHAMNELASATEVTKVITIGNHSTSKAKHTLNSVSIGNAIEGITEHGVDSAITGDGNGITTVLINADGDGVANDTESGSTKVVRIKHDFYRS